MDDLTTRRHDAETLRLYNDGLAAMIQPLEGFSVADTANNRILFWPWPLRNDLAPAATAVIGQPDFAANGENRWKAVTHDTICWPYGIHVHRGTLAVADSGNNRVMLWDVQDQ